MSFLVDFKGKPWSKTSKPESYWVDLPRLRKRLERTARLPVNLSHRLRLAPGVSMTLKKWGHQTNGVIDPCFKGQRETPGSLSHHFAFIPHRLPQGHWGGGSTLQNGGLPFGSSLKPKRNFPHSEDKSLKGSLGTSYFCLFLGICWRSPGLFSSPSKNSDKEPLGLTGWRLGLENRVHRHERSLHPSETNLDRGLLP